MELQYLYKDNTYDESRLNYRDRKRPLVSYSQDDNKFIYMPKVPEVGDIVYFSNEEQKLKQIEVEDYKPELGKAIGIVVIPASHRPNGKPVVMGGIEHTKEQLEVFEYLENADYSDPKNSDLIMISIYEFINKTLNYFNFDYLDTDNDYYSYQLVNSGNSIFKLYPKIKNLILSEEQKKFRKITTSQFNPIDYVDEELKELKYNAIPQSYKKFVL